MAASLFSSARLVNKPGTLNIDPPAHLIKAITSSKNGQTKCGCVTWLDKFEDLGEVVIAAVKNSLISIYGKEISCFILLSCGRQKTFLIVVSANKIRFDNTPRKKGWINGSHFIDRFIQDDLKEISEEFLDLKIEYTELLDRNYSKEDFKIDGSIFQQLKNVVFTPRKRKSTGNR